MKTVEQKYCFQNNFIHDKQGCLSFPARFFDSSKLIPLHPRNSTFGLRQSRMWPLHFIKNRYRKISKVTQNNPAYRRKNRLKFYTLSFLVSLFIFSLFLPFSAYSFMPDTEIAVFQKQIADKPVGERIAFWAEKFV
ncbi:MAG: hypothetical protein COS28_02190, partial [Nitrospirae bacterium CG02_land_8_20_14_3_00_44_33]